MKRVATVALSGSFLILLAACSSGGEGPGAAGAWIGTLTTEGDVTTVVNESGSVWGGTATLVEETSIGVESGDENYMFDRIRSVHATDSEIYVLDNTPVLRVFDHDGNHLRNLGGVGQGPGEFQRPRWVAAAPDGRVFVYAGGNGRINIYGPEPGAIDSWPAERSMCCIHPMVVTPANVVWLEYGVRNEERRSFDLAFLAHGPDGPGPEPLLVPTYDYERWTLRYNDRDIEAIPNAPETVFQMLPSGLMVAGGSNAYRFEIISPTGSKTVVERYWTPIEVSATELDYHTRSIPARYSQNEAGNDAGLSWDGRLPTHKPAFRSFLGTRDGDIWVLREGATTDIEDCDPNEMVSPPVGTGPDWPRRCFAGSWIIDVFDGEGRYLGEVAPPGGRLPIPAYTFVTGNTLVTQAQDEAGTIMVKRYRLVLPGEEEQ